MTDSSLIVISILFVGCCLCLIVYSCFGLLFSRSGKKTDDSTDSSSDKADIVSPLNIHGDWKLKSGINNMIGSTMNIFDDSSEQIQVMLPGAPAIKTYKIINRLPNKIDAEYDEQQQIIYLQATKDLILISIKHGGNPIGALFFVPADSVEGKALPVWTPPQQARPVPAQQALPLPAPLPMPTPTDNNVQAAPTSSSSISSTPALAA